jgi:cytoskeleton protein RodZ
LPREPCPRLFESKLRDDTLIEMPSERPSGGLGKKLREARDRRGLSLGQIASSTKIAVSILDALERNDISRLPGGIFGRAFVRSFASEVGLDPEAAIQEFIAQFPHDSVTVGHSPSERTDEGETIESDRRMASTFVGLIALSIPIAAFVVYIGATGRGAQPALAHHAATPDRARAAAPPGDGHAALEAPDGDGLTVDLSVRRPCWVSAIVDGNKEIDGMLPAGDRRTIHVRRELVLTTADGGAIEMMVNGAAAKPLGKSGNAVTARLDPMNFRQYLLAP